MLYNIYILKKCNREGSSVNNSNIVNSSHILIWMYLVVTMMLRKLVVRNTCNYVIWIIWKFFRQRLSTNIILQIFVVKSMDDHIFYYHKYNEILIYQVDTSACTYASKVFLENLIWYMKLSEREAKMVQTYGAHGRELELDK